MIPQSKLIEQSSDQFKPESGSLEIRGLSLQIAATEILQNVDVTVSETGITSLIGPSGAGKSSLLRCLNGLYQQWQGEINLQGGNIRHWPGGWDKLRRHVGLIAQKPCVFPRSIRANVAFGIQGWRQRRRADQIVETVLKQAALWDEVKQRLDSSAESLSLGQQQRLCIARALAIKPGLLLLDEPTTSLDPRSKQLIEQSILLLSESIPVVCVTHDLEQAKRLGGDVVFMCDGKVIEQASSEQFFIQPQRLESREFLRWSVCECG
jgi:phosphate transport system ATP-binding protein